LNIPTAVLTKITIIYKLWV